MSRIGRNKYARLPVESSTEATELQPPMNIESVKFSASTRFDESTLPSKSYMQLLLNVLLIIMITNVLIGNSAWWYKRGAGPNVMFGFLWTEFVVAIVSALALFWVRYRGFPRATPEFPRLPVFADSHYLWASMAVIAAVGFSSVSVIFANAWATTYPEFDDFMTKINIKEMSAPTAKMHSDYLIIQSIHTAGVVIFAIFYYGARHRETFPVYSRPIQEIVNAVPGNGKYVAIEAARVANGNSLLT